ncbi:DNA-directed RNA polymerase subunit beta' [bacterium]|nr:DNA-directed RNA polymerase subunit beta' [bacterium]
MMRKDSDNELENVFQSEDVLENADELTSDIAETIAAATADEGETQEPEGPISLPDDSQEEEEFDMWRHPVKENQFDKVTVTIASPDTIRSWSYGEVKNPETINYRTYKPEPGGLFCQHIFGPVKDWECACGKYKRIKYKGIVCDRCGVEVAQSKVRRERMGHIELAVPVAHIWFFKTMPSRMGAILDMTVRNLEQIIYLDKYIILDPGKSNRKKGEVITEEEKDKLRKEFPSVNAGTGAEALEVLLKEFDLDAEADKLYNDMQKTHSKQVRKKIAKRLKIIEGFRNSENKPEYMMIHVVPVLPPDLRPLVPLDGGRFATSDLNDLYRRVINRNNRLKILKSQRTPEVIINNEKRMLQEAVDALIDNGRHGRTVCGPSSRPLKSLSDNLKGKQGRFRQNLLGKRVDYSGRSVIVVGPELKMTQCGLPKKMALQLFEPFIIRELKKGGIAQTIKTAKKVIERGDTIVWDILEQVTKGHVVMLNRAPTLHRLGIQAFEPLLIEGNSIRVHPLVCGGFNADFDGDQMAVHVPLSREALWEAKHFMMAPENLFSPASGKPMMMPTQDIVLGIYYLTHDPWLKEHAKSSTGTLTPQEVHRAYDNGVISLHHSIKVVLAPNWKAPEEAAPEGKKEEIVETTAGRIFFNELLPKELNYYNKTIDKKGLAKLINDCFEAVGSAGTVETLDRIKKAGFHESTRAGISISTSDMMVPQSRDAVLLDAQKKVNQITKQHAAGAISEKERYNSVVDVWTTATNTISEDLYAKLQSKAEELRELNPLHMMVDSGARGSRDQIKQLAGMRGLMANPSGEIIETPIRSNFKQGLSMLEYFISSHGARKGLADTALKTADAGYLTRRLVDVAHDIIITCDDCKTPSGIKVTAIKEGNKVLVKLSDRIKGRTALYDIMKPGSTEIMVKAGELITGHKAVEIEESGIETVTIRSVLTCEAPYGVCAKCYGMDLSKYELVKAGTPVGIIAAQSIGEPGTQLTMRTFHIGGTANKAAVITAHKADKPGRIVLENIHAVESEDGVRVLNKYGIAKIVDDKTGAELSRFDLEIGSLLKVQDGQKVKKGDDIDEWDPYIIPMYTEVSGTVHYKDVEEGKTLDIRRSEEQGDKEERVILSTREDLHPEIQFVDELGNLLGGYPIPVNAILVAEEGDVLKVGALIAKTPRQESKTKDITGGLPRVEELFEARRPNDAAEIAVIDGIISFPEKSIERGHRIIKVTSETTGEVRYHKVPLTQQLFVSAGDRIRKGQPLTEGSIEPHQLLDVCGVRELQSYLLDQVREVYRSQGVEINDKHIEVILRQMLRKVKITDPGDTPFLYDDEVERSRFEKENRKAQKEGKRSAKGMPLLQGITKAGLSTSSFISAASFQETTRVLTEAAATGREDPLMGFKENIIMGHLVPSGTGFSPERFTGEQKDGEIELGYTATSEQDSAFLLDTDDSENEIVGSVNDLLGSDFSKGEGSDSNE